MRGRGDYTSRFRFNPSDAFVVIHFGHIHRHTFQTVIAYTPKVVIKLDFAPLTIDISLCFIASNEE